jgi:hypothetical protein
LNALRANSTACRRSGCSKAEKHERTREDVVELFHRIREVERAQAEGRGKLVVIVAILTAAAGLLFEWIGKHLT